MEVSVLIIDTLSPKFDSSENIPPVKPWFPVDKRRKFVYLLTGTTKRIHTIAGWTTCLRCQRNIFAQDVRTQRFCPNCRTAASNEVTDFSLMVSTRKSVKRVE